MARVVPVHKTGDKHRIQNYRPISITCTCCKMFEHILSKSLFNYIESSNILISNQHGFRSRLSTITQLAETVHDFAQVINETGQVDGICLDLSKAFDHVSHSDLIGKLLDLGVNLSIVKWIHSYLNNRSQYVEVKGNKSKILNVTSGVPQGSVLGPILFLCYINDMTNGLNDKIMVRLFADDCLIYSKISCHEDQLELASALEAITNWCTRWKMKINYEKTVYARITRKTRNVLLFNYKLDGNPIKQVSHFKYLGVTISDDLSWKKHITNLCNAAEVKLWSLRRRLKLAPRDVKLTAYLALVRPALEYASIIWDPYKKKEVNQIEKIQRRAARFIMSKYRYSEISIQRI